MKAAIYTRVSTLDQAREGFSLAAQRNTLEKWALANGYNDIAFYSDEGISAKDIIHRPAMKQLIADAERREFDAVLVWALSRFTRSAADLFNTWELLKRKGIALMSHTESFDTGTPMGRAMMGMLGVFAQLEREITSDRVKAAMDEKASQGKRTCSVVLGYDKHGTDGMVINEQEATQIKDIYDWYLQMGSLTEVSNRCEETGYRGKRGQWISPWQVSVILTRPVYVGYYSYKGKHYRGNFNPIIDRESWNETQALLTMRGHGGKRRISLAELEQSAAMHQRPATISQ